MFLEKVDLGLVLVLFLLLPTLGHGQGRHRNLLEVAVHGKFQPGYYTLADGTRHAGKLRIWQTLVQNIVQVDQGKADPVNLAAEQMRHFTIGPDSFTVARHVALAGEPMTLPFGDAAFFRVMLKGKLQVLQYDQLVPGMGPQYGPSHYLAWVLRPAPESDLVVLPGEETAFARHVPAFFIDNPLLAQRIRAGLVGRNNFKRIVYSYIFRKEVEQVSYEEAATIFP